MCDTCGYGLPLLFVYSTQREVGTARFNFFTRYPQEERSGYAPFGLRFATGYLRWRAVGGGAKEHVVVVGNGRLVWGFDKTLTGLLPYKRTVLAPRKTEVGDEDSSPYECFPSPPDVP